MPPSGVKVIATNRQGRRDYDILETVECGIVLQGSEVKSLREAHVQFADANGWIRNGEVWLLGLHIAPYSHAAGVNVVRFPCRRLPPANGPAWCWFPERYFRCWRSIRRESSK